MFTYVGIPSLEFGAKLIKVYFKISMLTFNTNLTNLLVYSKYINNTIA